jgi:hypothetical protein
MRSLFLKFIALATILGSLVLPQAGHAEEKAGAEAATSRPATRLSPAEQAAQSATMARDARQKAEAMEQARDRRMKEISKGICTGC